VDVQLNSLHCSTGISKTIGKMRAFPMCLKILGGFVRINGPRVIYDNNERSKAHSFNAREKIQIWPHRVLLLLSRVLR
jgi:hypothetical protein